MAGRPLRDWAHAASSLRRSCKLYVRGDAERARRLRIDGTTSLLVPPPRLTNVGDALDLILPQPRPAAALAEPAVVIVPVHNGASHLRRLFATLFDHTDPKHRILLADDGSTDPEVASLLAAAAGRANVHVLASATNRGFVATVNTAMQVTNGHAAILNTDTEVPAGWLERLLQPIAVGTRTASTTPFSNAAAIYSFPIPDLDQGMPPGLDVGKIDSAFSRLVTADDCDLATPTPIGFCMGVNRAAWQACGPFDEAAFGRGYCEETDWCLRSAAAGWCSVLVPNLFVYHAHGGTFAGGERKALLEANIAALHRRWPAYYRQLSLFRRHDPWSGCRAAALLALATAQAARPLLVLGVGRDTEVAAALADGRGVVRWHESGGRGAVPVIVERATWRASLLARSRRELQRLRLLVEPDSSVRC